MPALVELLTDGLTTDQERAVRGAAAALPDTWRVTVATIVTRGQIGLDVRVNGPGFVTMRSFDESSAPQTLSWFVTETVCAVRHHPAR